AMVGLDNFGAPALLAQVNTVQVTSVALSGDRAVLGNGSALAVWDVSTPTSPSLLGSVATAGPVRRIRLSGRLALVSEGAAGVELWDFSSGTPVKAGAFAAGRADDAMVAGDLLVVADGFHRVSPFALPSAIA